MDSPVLELMNSGLPPGAGDRLDEPRWLQDVCRRFGIPLPQQVNAQELTSLRALRSVLRRLGTRVSDGAPPMPHELAYLNEILGRAPVRPQLFRTAGGLYGMELTPLEPGWSALMAEFAGHFARLLLISQPTRLKFCPSCDRAFYDATRGRKRIWCDGRTCGNRVRVQRFRDRSRPKARRGVSGTTSSPAATRTRSTG
ncbi:MAG TPA: CGNR zinc finger domain-containing protein [Gaiellaceae bacterium]|nr:CGNR zinc finger domain-containing protein [Gaiellaceae bacterium]